MEEAEKSIEGEEQVMSPTESQMDNNKLHGHGKADTTRRVPLFEKIKNKLNLVLSFIWDLLRSIFSFRGLIVFSLSLLITVLTVYLVIVTPKKSDTFVIFTANKTPVYCSVMYPSFISKDDAKSLDLSISNKAGEIVSNFRVSLIVSEKIPIIIDSNGGSSIVEFGKLKIDETKTARMKFRLNDSFNYSKVPIKLRIEVNKENPKERFYTIKIFDWFPEVDKISKIILSTLAGGIGLMLAAYINEKIKNAMA